MVTRACLLCGQVKDRKLYSSAQWRKGNGFSKCRDCVEDCTSSSGHAHSSSPQNSSAGCSSRGEIDQNLTSKQNVLNLQGWNKENEFAAKFESAFTLAEKMMNMRATQLNWQDQGPEIPDYELRCSLLSIARHYDSAKRKGLAPGAVIFQDKQERNATIFEVLAFLEGEDGMPILLVQWMKATKRSATEIPRGLHVLNDIIEKLKRRDGEPIVLDISSSLEEQRLLHNELLKNQGPERKYTLPASTRAEMRTSYITVIAPPEEFSPPPPKAVKVCAVCNEPSALQCARCHAVYYCSREHQKLHWKQQGHRAVCRSTAEAAAAAAAGRGVPEASSSVVIPVEAPASLLDEPGFGPGFLQANISLTQGTATVHARGDAAAGRRRGAKKTAGGGSGGGPTNVHGDREFVVKAQVSVGPAGPGPLLLYDAERSFQRFVGGGEPAYAALAAAVRAEPAHGGRKAYLRARREAGTFRLWLRPLPSQRQGF